MCEGVGKLYLTPSKRAESRGREGGWQTLSHTLKESGVERPGAGAVWVRGSLGVAFLGHLHLVRPLLLRLHLLLPLHVAHEFTPVGLGLAECLYVYGRTFRQL